MSCPSSLNSFGVGDLAGRADQRVDPLNGWRAGGRFVLPSFRRAAHDTFGDDDNLPQSQCVPVLQRLRIPPGLLEVNARELGPVRKAVQGRRREVAEVLVRL